MQLCAKYVKFHHWCCNSVLCRNGSAFQQLSHQGVDTAHDERAKLITHSDRREDALSLSLSLSFFSSGFLSLSINIYHIIFSFTPKIPFSVFSYFSSLCLYVVEFYLLLYILPFLLSLPLLLTQYTLRSHHLFPHPSVSWGCFTGVPAMSWAGLGMSITGLW